MSQTYLLSSKDTEITITHDNLMIKSLIYEKISTSLLYRIKKFLVYFISVFIVLLIAGVTAYFGLYSVTIDCERPSLESAATCSVTKNNFIRYDEVLLSKQPIKEINIRWVVSGEKCSLELMTVNNTVISPLGTHSYSSRQCGLNSNLEPIKQLLITDWYKRPNLVGSETATLPHELFPWLVVLSFSFLGIMVGRFLVFEGFLIKTIFDRRSRTITMSYVRLFATYQKKYSFSDVREVVFIDNANSEQAEKGPYLLLENFKKIEVEIYGEIAEKHQVINHVNQVLA